MTCDCDREVTPPEDVESLDDLEGERDRLLYYDHVRAEAAQRRASAEERLANARAREAAVIEAIALFLFAVLVGTYLTDRV